MAKAVPQTMAEEIVKLAGGKENIKTVACCATRLRMTLHDYSKADRAAIKAINGVMGLVEQNEQLQIILGPGMVTKVTNIVGQLTSLKIGKVDEVAERKAELKKKNSTPFKLFIRKLSNIFVPLIPGFVGCGIIYGMAKLLENQGILTGNAYQMAYVLGKGIFLYMNIMVGVFTAREFGGSESLGGTLAGIMMSPQLAKIVVGGQNLVPEQGGVIAVLIACALGATLEKKLRKIMPSVLDLMVTPTIVILVIGLGCFYIIQPLGSWLTNNITWLVNTSIEKGRMITGAAFSTTFLPLVMTGLHRALTPVETSLLQATGVDLLRPILAMAGAGQVGAGIAIFMKTRSKRMKNVIGSSLPIGMLGVGEPLMFGVTLPLGKPFITACLGSALGGMYVAAKGVASTGIGLSGIPLALLMPDGSAAINYLIGTVLAYLGGFLLTYFTKWEDVDDNDEFEMDNPLKDIIKM